MVSYTVYSTQYTHELYTGATLYTVHNTLGLHCIQYTIHWSYTAEILFNVYSTQYTGATQRKYYTLYTVYTIHMGYTDEIL